ncbi:hypothetical protein MAR_033323 [Mya arenaria]|uniref:SMP-30/Gluconolactonase/LRE-like region domain-containing protein n=1 Tax=Mya arenaria TaxID=6604 RepID=A0ABY7GCU3_MYAAR|nr:hypothetical protein MAR_033323 [Mya arenaria]
MTENLYAKMASEPTDAPTIKKLGEMELLGTDGHEELGDISGMTFVGDRFLVAADTMKRCLRCFDMDREKQVGRYYSGFRHLGITTIPGNRVAVTSDHEVWFLRVTEKGDPLLENKIHVKESCYGIASSGDNLIVCYDPDPGVHILDMKGNVIKEFETDDEGKNLFVRPSSLAVSPDHNTIYIFDDIKNTVNSLTQDGRVLGVVDVEEHLSFGSAITVDSAGRVYVCGIETVLLVSFETGTVTRLLGIKDGIGRPICVAVCDKTQRLFLPSCYSTGIQVYNMSKHTTA